MKRTKFSLRQSTNSSRRKIIAAVAILLLLASGIGTYAIMQSRDEQNLVDESSSQPKDGSAAETSNKAIEQDKAIVTQYQGDSVNNSPTLTGIINYSSVVDNVAMIRVTIDQIVSSGTCKLELKNTSLGKIITKNANIAQNPSSATCEGFDVPTSELGSGTWNIEITIQGDNKTGVIRGEITV